MFLNFNRSLFHSALFRRKFIHFLSPEKERQTDAFGHKFSIVFRPTRKERKSTQQMHPIPARAALAVGF